MIKEFENTEDQFQQLYALFQKYHPYSPMAGSYEACVKQHTLFMDHDRVKLLAALQAV